MGSLAKESRYRDIVESHLQNRLPQEGLHSSFERLSIEEAAEETRPPPAYSQTDPMLPRGLELSGEDGDLTEDDAGPSRLLLHYKHGIGLPTDSSKPGSPCRCRFGRAALHLSFHCV